VCVFVCAHSRYNAQALYLADRTAHQVKSNHVQVKSNHVQVKSNHVINSTESIPFFITLPQYVCVYVCVNTCDVCVCCACSVRSV